MNKNIDLTSFKNKKNALVLSGGVVKAAAWHLGVANALEELGFSFKHNHSLANSLEISTYVGSSAGSLINLYLACGYTPTEVINATINNSKGSLKGISYSDILSFKRPQMPSYDSKFYNPLDGLPFLIKKMAQPLLSISGLFSTEGLNQYMQKHLIHSQNFSDYEADMFVVASKLDHSHKVIFSKYNYPSPKHDQNADYFNDVNVTEAICASMSVPPFFSPFPIENKSSNEIFYYIDGEIRETLSTHVAVDNNCENIISSWTHTPYHYHNEIGSLIKYGLPAICTQAIYLMIQRKILAHRFHHNQAQETLNTVYQYMKDNKFNEKDIKNITEILENSLNAKNKSRFIDIYPDHQDANIFFANPFSLDSEHTKKIINDGYKKTLEVFNNF